MTKRPEDRLPGAFVYLDANVGGWTVPSLSISLRRVVVIGAVTLSAGLLAACTPEQVAVFHTLAPDQQAKVVDHVVSAPYEWRSMGENGSTDCYAAIDRHWPASSRSWARSIVWRESRNQPTAQNRSSSAAGCFQLMRLHAARFQKLGYGWADRYNADANTLVALDLYREAGTSPWRL